MLDRDDLAGVADQFPPPHRDAGFEGDLRRRGRDDLRAVLGRLRSEPLQARQRDHPGGDPFGLEQVAGGDRHPDLGAGGEQDDGRLTCGGVQQHVAALREQLGGRRSPVSALDGRDVLTGQDQRGRTVGVPQRLGPGLRGLVGVGRAHHVQPRDGAQRGEVLDRLVGGTVLADSHRVVGPDEDGRDLRQRGQPDRGAHVVGEDEEGSTVGARQARQGDPVEDIAHRVLADAEVQGAAVVVADEGVAGLLRRQEGRLALHRGVVRPGEVGRAAPELGKHVGERAQHLSGRHPGRLLADRELRQRRLEAFGQFARPQPLVERVAVGVGGLPLLEAGLPGGPGLGGTGGRVGPGVLQHRRVDGEVGFRVEAEFLLQAGDLLGPQLGAVHRVVAGLGRQRPADDRGQLDEGRLVSDCLGRLDGVVEGLDVLLVGGHAVGPVDVLDVPAVGLIARGDVLGERDLGLALDRDPVVVVDQDEVAELLGSGQRGRLTGDALLHAAVTGDAVHEVVEDGGAGLGGGVEQRALAAGSHREADRVGDPGPQRAGGALDTCGVAVLGVAGGQRTLGAQRRDVVHLQAVARQQQLVVLGERGVACRQHEAVPSGPGRVGGVAVHHLLVQQVRNRGERDGRPGVTVPHPLHGIRGEDPGGVDSAAVEVRPGKGLCRGHHRPFTGSIREPRQPIAISRGPFPTAPRTRRRSAARR